MSFENIDELQAGIKLGILLKEARLKAGMKQNEAAAQMGFSQGHISAFENGRRCPSALDLFKFAKIYKVSLSYFDPLPKEKTEGKDELDKLFDENPRKASFAFIFAFLEVAREHIVGFNTTNKQFIENVKKRIRTQEMDEFYEQLSSINPDETSQKDNTHNQESDSNDNNR